MRNFPINIKKKLLRLINTFKNTDKDLIQLLIISNGLINNSDIDVCADIKQFFIHRSKNYEDSLPSIKNSHYDLIFTDCELENIKAIKKIRELSINSRRTPIIAITLSTEKDNMVKILSYGFDDYLTKPFNNKSLESVLSRWLSKLVLRSNEISNSRLLENLKNAKKQKNEKDFLSTRFKKRSIKNNDFKKNNALNSIKKILDIEASLKYSHYNNELARDLLVLLIISIKSERHKVISFYKQNKWNEIGDLAHKLYGISCYCGVAVLQNKTKEIEIAVNENNTVAIKNIYPEFLRAMDDLLIWNETHDIDVIFDLK
jgi:two-component system sensor histidine kinase BarA